MSLFGRIGAGVKAFAMAFQGKASSLWSAFSGRSNGIDYGSVGDGTHNSIVAATLGWIARNFPEAPVRIREKDEGGEWTSTEDVGANRMVDLLRHPNPYFSGILLWMATIVDYWVNGNAFWVKVRGGPGGAITELWWIPWAMVDPKWPEDGSVYLSHYIYKPDGSKEIRVEVEDAVHFRYGLDPDNIRVGRSPLTTVLREVFTDDEAAAFSAALLRNLGVPGVVISNNDPEAILDQDASNSIKTSFQEKFGGENRGDPLVISGKVNVDVLSFSPQQMDLTALRRVPEERISGVTGVPAIVAGLGAGLDRSTFANFQEAREAGWEENLIPTQRLLAAQIDVQLTPEFVADPSRFLVDFDTTEVRVLQEDQNKIWARAGDAASKGLITLATYKQQVGLPVDEDLDRVYLRAFNVLVVPEDEQLAPAVEAGTPTAAEVEPPPEEEAIPATNGHAPEEAASLLEEIVAAGT
jgi:HK97 family phage portal protein